MSNNDNSNSNGNTKNEEVESNVADRNDNVSGINGLKGKLVGSKDDDKNLKDLNYVRKILRLVELKKEAELNVELTRGIASDLKHLTFVSLIVMLVGIIFLVL